MGRRFLKVKNLVLSYLILIICLVGCSSLPEVDITYPQLEPPCKVAIIPFGNQTKDPTISRILYRILLAQLVKSKIFEVIPEGEVRQFMLVNRVLPGQPLSPDKIKLLAQKSGADAIIEGEVLQVVNDKKGDVQLAFNLWVRDAHTGRLLWWTHHRRTGKEYQKILHFGRICTITGLANRMITEVLKEWRDKGLTGCV